MSEKIFKRNTSIKKMTKNSFTNFTEKLIAETNSNTNLLHGRIEVKNNPKNNLNSINSKNSLLNYVFDQNKANGIQNTAKYGVKLFSDRHPEIKNKLIESYKSTNTTSRRDLKDTTDTTAYNSYINLKVANVTGSNFNKLNSERKQSNFNFNYKREGERKISKGKYHSAISSPIQGSKINTNTNNFNSVTGRPLSNSRTKINLNETHTNSNTRTHSTNNVNHNNTSTSNNNIKSIISEAKSPTTSFTKNPDIAVKSIINQKSQNFTYQFFELAKKIKNKNNLTNLTGTTNRLSEYNMTNSHCHTESQDINNSNIKKTILEATNKNTNLNNTGQRNKNSAHVKLKPNVSCELPIKEIKNIVLTSTLSNNSNKGVSGNNSAVTSQKNSNQNVNAYSKNQNLAASIKKEPSLENSNCVFNDKVNFYEVNIGRYLNFNKDHNLTNTGGTNIYMDHTNSQSASILNLNNTCQENNNYSENISPKIVPKKSINLFKKNSRIKMNSSGKNSFSNLINIHSVQTPEELHYTSVMFYNNNKKMSNLFDKEPEIVDVFKKADLINRNDFMKYASVRIFEKEVDI